MKKFNRRINDDLALQIGITNINESKQYRITEEQRKKLHELTHYTARQSSELDNAEFGTTKHYWIKEKGLSRFVKVESEESKINLEDIKKVIKSLKLPKVGKLKPTKSNKTLRIILTDIHVGLNPKENSYSLYDYTWNAEQLNKRKLDVIQSVIDLETEFEEIHLIDLGDFTDGFNAETTRGGHKLAQNMTNREQFENAFNFKTSLLLQLQEMFNVKVVNYNAVNCNHSADLDYIVNSSVKTYVEQLNKYISVNNVESFLGHYKHYNHTFVITHAKDEKHMKFGLKVHLDAKGVGLLEDYCRVNGLNGKITVEKGDSHQQLIDECTSKVFDYNNYLAFSPPSNWVQTNFGSSKSGFNLMIINSKNNDKQLLTKYF